MKTKRILSIALTLVMLLGMLPGMNLTAYAANNLTIYIMDMLENMDDNEWGYQLYDGDVSIAEGTYVQINMGTWHTGVMNIYMNGEVVYTKPSGSLYKDDVYHFTAGPNCKILGGYQNMFDWDGNPNVYITQDASVAVTGVTLNPNTAQTIDVGGSVAFTATVTPENATDKKVKWSVGGTDASAVKLYSNEACTTEVGADATETRTVYAKGISAGSATVTVTSNADSEKKASCDVTVNAAQTQTEELLTTITGTGSNTNSATSANVSYSVEGVATLTFSGSVAYQASPAWGWWGYGWTATVNAAEGYKITKCIFYDDANRTATDSEAPFVVETTENDKTPRINGSPIDGGIVQSKGLKKIDVYGYATPTATHSVTITAGDHMTKTAGSGDAEQTGLTGAMTDVVYTADNGYYYPKDYSVAEVSGIKVTRDSYTQITVSGTPTADAAITLPAPTAKTTPAAPTTAAATDCTTADNNDGKLTGVTTAMEYKKSDVESWLPGSENGEITGLVPGTYYVRVKATDTANASGNQELTIANYNTAAANTVSNTISALPAAADVTLDNAQAVADAKAAYDALTDDQKALVPADTVNKLNAAVAKIADLTAANTVSNTISALPDFSNVTTANKDAIEAARTVYNALTNDQKALVSADTLKKLTDAEDKLVIIQVMSEVSAKTGSDMTYTGSPIQLINTPTTALPAGYTMKYAVTTENTAPMDDNLYTTSIPSKTNAGTYYVWYKAVGDEGHPSTEPECKIVRLAKAVLTVIAKNQTVQYGNPVVQGRYTVKGLAKGDKVVVQLYAKLATNEVKSSVTANKNYTVKKVSGILTIKGSPNAKALPSGKTITVSYAKVKNADGYDIYAGYCGSNSYPLAKTMTGNSVTATKLTKIGGKAIDTKKNVFLYVVAYKNVGGKKVTLVRSASIRIAGLSTKHTNAKSVGGVKPAVTLKKGATLILKPSVTPVDPKKPVYANPAKFMFASHNNSVAKVDAKGRITAVGKGTANIYTYAPNGVKAKITVTVK